MNDEVEAGAGSSSPGHGAGPFIDAVLAQLSRGIGDAGAGAQEQLDELAGRLTSILLAAEQDDVEPAVRLLTEDPTLLSTIFQNIDLLYAHDYPYADALGIMTLDAVHRAVEADEGKEG